MNDWNIQSRAHVCETCGQAFADRQPYHTVLFDERAGPRRQDICAACWTRDGAELRQRKTVISCWQGQYEAPVARAPEAIQKDTAESLLRKLIERNDPRFAPAAYILAVMLERKRLLKVKEQLGGDGQRVFIYEQPKTGDLFTIPDPGLHLDQLEQVQHDVAALLEHGLPEVATSAPAALPEAPAGEATAPLVEPAPESEVTTHPAP